MSKKVLVEELPSNGKGSWKISFIVLLIISGIIWYFFLYLQHQYVKSWSQFLMILGILLLISFWSAVMEAALSTTTSEENKYLSDLENEAQKILLEYSKFSKDQYREPSRIWQRPSKNVKKFEKRIRRLDRLVSVANGLEKPVYVGSFASLSVFGNLSIGIFIPLVMHENVNRTLNFTLPEDWLAKVNSASSLVGYQFSHQIDLSSEMAFLFAISTLPVLIFGKLIPKKIGLNNSHWWLERNGEACFFIRKIFGWITVGSTWWIKDKQDKRP